MGGAQLFLDAAWQHARVLIADDVEVTRTALARSLSLFGLEPLEACGGEEALALADSERPDLILLDLHMPGLSGEEVLARLKESESLRAIPVVMISGDDDLAAWSRLRTLGAAGYLAKPFSLTNLASTVQRGLESREDGSASGPAAPSVPFQTRLLRSLGSHLPISYGILL